MRALRVSAAVSETISNQMILFLKQTFKGTVSRDFRPFFDLKIRSRPHMNRQAQFCKIFRLAEIFDRDVRKSGVSVVNYYEDTQFFL